MLKTDTCNILLQDICNYNLMVYRIYFHASGMLLIQIDQVRLPANLSRVSNYLATHMVVLKCIYSHFIDRKCMNVKNRSIHFLSLVAAEVQIQPQTCSTSFSRSLVISSLHNSIHAQMFFLKSVVSCRSVRHTDSLMCSTEAEPQSQ